MKRNMRKLREEARKFFTENISKGFSIDDINEVYNIAMEEAKGQFSTIVIVANALEIGFSAGRNYEKNRRQRADSVGDRLKNARGNMPAEDVCRNVGITEKALNAYETGKRLPRDTIKIKLAEYYGKSVGELFF